MKKSDKSIEKNKKILYNNTPRKIKRRGQMLVNRNLSRELYEDAGEQRIQKAKEYIKQGRVDILESDYEDMNNFAVKAKIDLVP